MPREIKLVSDPAQLKSRIAKAAARGVRVSQHARVHLRALEAAALGKPADRGASMFRGRELRFQEINNKWISVRSALLEPVRSRPGAARRLSHRVRYQIYDPVAQSWLASKNPLSPAERAHFEALLDDVPAWLP